MEFPSYWRHLGTHLAITYLRVYVYELAMNNNKLRLNLYMYLNFEPTVEFQVLQLIGSAITPPFGPDSRNFGSSMISSQNHSNH